LIKPRKPQQDKSTWLGLNPGLSTPQGRKRMYQRWEQFIPRYRAGVTILWSLRFRKKQPSFGPRVKLYKCWRRKKWGTKS